MTDFLTKKLQLSLASLPEDEMLGELELRKKMLLFPLDIFSKHLDFMTELQGIGCDRNAIGPSMLATLATAIGAGAKWKINQTQWQRFSNLWVLIVGDSGTGKTKGDGFILKPLKYIDKELSENSRDDLQRGLISQEAKLVTFKQKVIQNNPKGVLKYGDELRGWMETIEKDKETEFWLSTWTGESIKVDRKEKTYTIPHSCVTVYGGTQPCFMNLYFQNKKEVDGFSARFLFSHISNQEYQFPNYDRGLNEEYLEQWDDKVTFIYDNLPLSEWNDKPKIIHVEEKILSGHVAWAKKEYEKRRISGMEDRVFRAMLKKMEEYVWRISLILEIYNQEDLAKPFKIGAYSFDAACRVASYFVDSYLISYSMYKNDTAPAEIRMIAQLINNGISQREIARGLKKDPGNFNKEIKKWRNEYPLIWL